MSTPKEKIRMNQNYFLPSYLRGSPFEEYNEKNYLPLLLPTHWNSADGDDYITIVDESKLSLKYSGNVLLRYKVHIDSQGFISIQINDLNKLIGPGRNWVDAASIRSNNRISPEVGLYYFEITVIDRGHRGCIGIGLSKPGTRLNRMPGWEPDTIGYHGDDGHLYHELGTGRKFGPLYTTGETVGCGINYYDKEIFFTKNGIILGVVANKDNFNGVMIPTCGMESPNESAMVNFGARPFVFNIEVYAKTIFANAKQKEKKKAEAAAEIAENNGDVTQVSVETAEEGSVDAAADTMTDGNVVQRSDTVTPPEANNVPDAITILTSDNAVNIVAAPVTNNITDINTIQQVEISTADGITNNVTGENAINEMITALTDISFITPDTRDATELIPAVSNSSTTTIEPFESPALEPDPIPPLVNETIISGNTIEGQSNETFTGATGVIPNVVDITVSNSVDLIEVLPPDVVTVAEDSGITQNTIDVSLVS
ncbi:3192_t:CDS:2 [Acaulospora morrowiae]|uniref:3192_t:CDS:1 n=1 Tax=Acaulospora morrowiae TaxID=94023 RepID=A0A9N9FPT6_9GLOM|nr:3192_t:CDS:2 [Acaulospora morrowiae]